MANIKSAKKRIAVNEKKYQRNKSLKSSTKTAIKKFMAAVAAGDRATIVATHKAAVSTIDKVTSKGVFHKNTASRKKSQLAKLANK
ncbi:MAG: 30S ribosomal protein S20 [Firmicutes bacterium]|nr:30S ribosomal protein S20 [Bacillota bacterium]